MSEVTQYSVGIDLGQTPWRVAIARGGIAEISNTPDGRPPALSGSSGAGDGPGSGDVVVAAVGELVQRFGGLPSGVVLCVPDDQRAGNVDLAGEVARRLDVDVGRVRLIGEDDAVLRWLAHVNESGRGGADSSAFGDRAAMGAALSGTTPDAEQPSSGLLAAGAAGAAGVAIGGAGAAMLAGPPTAVAAGTAGGVGPAGVSVGGPAGVSLGGPGGVSLGGPGGVSLGGPAGVSLGGPAGVPIVAAVVVRRFPLIPALAGAAAVLIVGAGVAVVASGDDAATTAPPTTELAVVIPETDPGTSIIVTTLAPTTLAPTTLAPTTLASAAVATTEQSASTSSTSATTVPLATSSSCVVGSWLADNDAILAAMSQAAGANPIPSVTGAVRLDIGSDGALVTTYDNWLETYTDPGGAGSTFSSVIGVDTNTVVFADDGTYSVTATQIGSRWKTSALNVVVFDLPSPDTMFLGSGAYTCSGDRLVIVAAAGPIYSDVDITMVFTRGG